jgi:tetratricopeptide (TPR) repeat protein
VVRRVTPTLTGDADLAEVTAELSRAALLRELEGGLRLAHPLLRDAATATIDPVRRGELHGLVADALERSRASEADGGGTVLSIARHRLAGFEVTGTPDRAVAAVRAGVDGAAMARRLGSPSAARELYERALAAWRRVPPAARDPVRPAAFTGQVGLGAVRADAGEHALAAEAFTDALALARTDDEVARAEQAWAQLPYRQGDLDASLARLQGALERIADARPAAQARLLVEIGWIHYRRRDREALPTLAQAVELAERTDEWTLRTRALDRHAFALARLEGDDAALPLFERASAAASRSGDPREQAIVHLHRVRPLYRVGRRYEARTSLGTGGDAVRAARAALPAVGRALDRRRPRGGRRRPRGGARGAGCGAGAAACAGQPAAPGRLSGAPGGRCCACSAGRTRLRPLSRR